MNAFIRHLNKCSERVKAWPKWKREMMGYVFKIDRSKTKIKIKEQPNERV